MKALRTWALPFGVGASWALVESGYFEFAFTTAIFAAWLWWATGLKD